MYDKKFDNRVDTKVDFKSIKKEKIVSYGKKNLAFQMPHEPLHLDGMEKCGGKNKRLLGPADIKQAICFPIGTQTLNNLIKPSDKVIILAPDNTRSAKLDILLPVLVEELEEIGVTLENITLLFATGLHGKQSNQEKVELIGKRLFYKLTNIVDHDADDDNNMVAVGNIDGVGPLKINKLLLESDKIICTGSVRFHSIAGFSGGGKIILPGVSGRETIIGMHSQDFRRNMTKNYSGVLEPNPFQQSLRKAVDLVKPVFFINTVVNRYGDLIEIAAGSLESVHQICSECVKEAYGIEIKEKVPFLIVGAGGEPFDISWPQTQKALQNWINVVKDNGWIIVVGKCSKGFSNPNSDIDIFKYNSIEDVEKELHRNFDVDLHRYYKVLLTTSSKKKIILISDLDDELLKKMKFHLQDGNNASEKLRNAVKFVESNLSRNYKYYFINDGGIMMPIPTNS